MRPAGAGVSVRHGQAKQTGARPAETARRPLSKKGDEDGDFPQDDAAKRRGRGGGGCRRPGDPQGAGGLCHEHDEYRDAGRPSLVRPDLDHRQHHRLLRRDGVRHAVRARREFPAPAGDGGQVEPERGQAHLYLRAARRPDVAGQHAGHRRRLRRLDPSLGGSQQRRPVDHAVRQGSLGQGREDFRARAQGAARPRHLRVRRHQHARLLHDAPEGRRDGPLPAGQGAYRLGSFRLQPGPDAAGQPLRFRQVHQICAAVRASFRARGRQGGQARPGDLAEHHRRPDRARRARSRARSTFSSSRRSISCRSSSPIRTSRRRCSIPPAMSG